MINMQGIAIAVLLFFIVHRVTALQDVPSFSSIVTQAVYGKEYKNVTNYNIEYIYMYPSQNISLMETARIHVESNATHDLPLIVVARQRNGILSWQIPCILNSKYFKNLSYNKTSRTLCATEYYRSEIEDDEEFVTVSVSTSSNANVYFKLNVTEETQFYLKLGEERSVEISPSEPVYYGYIFPNQIESSSVNVHVKSDNDICMTVSIQNTSCPVFDLETNIEFTGYWQTVNRQGSITIRREVYPLGFFVVLALKSDDTDCCGTPSMISLRNKRLTVTVNPSITKQDYIIASGVVVSVIISFCLFYVVGVMVSKIRLGREMNQLLNTEHEDIEEPIPSPSTIEETEPQRSECVDEDSSLDEDDIDLMEDALSDKDVIRTKLVLSVSDLARKDPKILRHKSRLYLYYLATVAIFYTLPVLQLVTTYQHVLHITGNQDMCYYNFLCAHPFGVISDFNHVFSNFGYVMLGLLFVFLTYSRENNASERERNKCYGIPQHYGLFYAMGSALIMEGILSGSYHVCPNRSNFQFDTSFMYIISVLCMIKIYQTRHPDINARAPITFGILALIIFIGLIGVLWNDSNCFWIIFTIGHLLICFFLTVQIYYMGRWKIRGLLTRIIQTCKYEARTRFRYLFRPQYPARFTMLVVANLCNVGLAVFGNITHQKNFATFLLAILMSNLILYTFFYIVMKICHKERILLQPSIYIILSMMFWGAAFYFFINKTISWALTPAQSRLYNKPCELLNFFDSHDIWHFLSALAMFFSFMVLLTLDDDLIDVHRSQIPVF